MNRTRSLTIAGGTRPAGTAPDRRHAAADGYEEEYDEIESLPFDSEHDEDDRDPEPERRLAPDHAQERKNAGAKGHRPSRGGRREGRSRG